jgi:hypothetical protein
MFEFLKNYKTAIERYLKHYLSQLTQKTGHFDINHNILYFNLYMTNFS